MEHQQTKKGKNLFSFFKSRDNSHSSSNVDTPVPNEQPPSKCQRIEIDSTSIQSDPALRSPIWQYPVNQRDAFRRAYIEKGATQPKLKEYPRSECGKQNRRFQYSWFKQFPWLEYSITNDATFCFPCFVFENERSSRGSFTTGGFNSWKRVNNGERCAFLMHVGGPNSLHCNAFNNMNALKNVDQSIERIINVQSSEEIQKNRLRLRTTIESIRWLVPQACPLRGHDESESSKNRGNFIQLIKLIGKLRVDIDDVVLDKAPKNAKYISARIQKKILHIYANKVRNKIREEVGDAKFFILVDEGTDEADSEQMAIVLRFVDIDGFLQERFFYVVHVSNTAVATLKEEISNVLLSFNLQIENIRGQGYDGASNMRGTWNGLQALFLNYCPYAYYVHCFAHRLQLALVAAAQDESSTWVFFSQLTAIVNFVGASPKRHHQLQIAQANEIAKNVATGERETGKGVNQIGTLHRAGATRWSSHFESICSLVDMYVATCTVLENLVDEGSTPAIRGEAQGHFRIMKTFEFVFILHLMHKIMALTNMLCKSLQNKSLDILNAVNCVKTTAGLLSTLRENGWDSHIEHVESVCRENDIDITDGIVYITYRIFRR